MSRRNRYRKSSKGQNPNRKKADPKKAVLRPQPPVVNVERPQHPAAMLDEGMLKNYLEERYPGAFRGWDSWGSVVTFRQLGSWDPECLVVLENEGRKVHKVFYIMISDTDDETERDIRIGGEELEAEFWEK